MKMNVTSGRASRAWHAGRACWLLLALWLGSAGSGWAADGDAEDVPVVPPPLVRLAELEGDVEVSTPAGPSSDGGWVRAERNLPLGAGSRLRTGATGRAVLQLGSTTLRAGSSSELLLRQLDEASLVVELVRGQLALGVRGSGEGIELLTAELRAVPLGPGLFRFDRNAERSAVGSWRGTLRAEDDRGTFEVGAGASIEVGSAHG